MSLASDLKTTINQFTEYCHLRADVAGWWHNRFDLTSIHEQIPTKLLLIHTEISEATEGFRKDAMDDHLPHRKMIEVELADAVIRICDLAGALQLDLGGAIVDKMEYNVQRADHKPENRSQPGGKKF